MEKNILSAIFGGLQGTKEYTVGAFCGMATLGSITTLYGGLSAGDTGSYAEAFKLSAAYSFAVAATPIGYVWHFMKGHIENPDDYNLGNKFTTVNEKTFNGSRAIVALALAVGTFCLGNQLFHEYQVDLDEARAAHTEMKSLEP